MQLLFAPGEWSRQPRTPFVSRPESRNSIRSTTAFATRSVRSKTNHNENRDSSCPCRTCHRSGDRRGFVADSSFNDVRARHRGHVLARVHATRNNNPNRQALEHGISALEGGAAAAAFASGTGASMSIFQALAPGDHILAHVDAYYGTSRLLREVFQRWGLDVSFVDMSDLRAAEKALRPKTKLAWMETPSNPLLKIVDLAAVAKIVHAAGAICVCDNTWAPILQRPFDLGADLILHSTTKYFGGHCDVLGGIVVSKVENDFFQRIRSIQYEGGASPLAF